MAGYELLSNSKCDCGMPGFHGFPHAKISLVDNTGVGKVISIDHYPASIASCDPDLSRKIEGDSARRVVNRVAAQPNLKLFSVYHTERLTIFSVPQVKVYPGYQRFFLVGGDGV